MDFARKRNCLRMVWKDERTRSGWDERYVMDILKRGDVNETEVFCMQENWNRRRFDVTLCTEEECMKFFRRWQGMREIQEEVEVFVSFLGVPRSLVVAMEDPFVKMEEVLSFLSEHAWYVKFQKDYVNRVGKWNGKRRFLIWPKEGIESECAGEIRFSGKNGFAYWENGGVRKKEGARVEEKKEEKKKEDDVQCELESVKSVQGSDYGKVQEEFLEVKVPDCTRRKKSVQGSDYGKVQEEFVEEKVEEKVLDVTRKKKSKGKKKEKSGSIADVMMQIREGKVGGVYADKQMQEKSEVIMDVEMQIREGKVSGVYVDKMTQKIEKWCLETEEEARYFEEMSSKTWDLES